MSHLVTESQAPATPATRREWVRRSLPVVGSIAFVAILFCRVPLAGLAHAVAALDWELLGPLTLVEVLALYLWDARCIAWLFSDPDRRIEYGQALRARGTSYGFSALNYHLGQGALAWLMSRVSDVSLAAAIGRCLRLTYHDLLVLFGLGLVGSLLSSHPRLARLRWICAIAVAVLAVLPLLARFAPARWRESRSRLTNGFSQWSVSRSITLIGLRLVYYGISLVYGAIGLHLAGSDADARLLLSVLPIVLLITALPISASGLGTRENTLLYLLNPIEPEKVVAFGFVWSAGVLVGRLGIGLGCLWLFRPAMERSKCRDC